MAHDQSGPGMGSAKYIVIAPLTICRIKELFIYTALIDQKFTGRCRKLLNACGRLRSELRSEEQSFVFDRS